MDVEEQRRRHRADSTIGAVRVNELCVLVVEEGVVYELRPKRNPVVNVCGVTFRDIAFLRCL